MAPNDEIRIPARTPSALKKAIIATRRTNHYVVELHYLAVQSRQRELMATARRLGEAYGADWPGLTRFEDSIYSQNGEDGVLFEIFHRMGISRGVFVEIGAWAGQANCLALAHYAAWSGAFIDGDADQARKMSAVFGNNSRVGVLHSFVTPSNVNDLVQEYSADHGLDLISIDVDGAEYWIWQALEVRPKVVVVEYNATLPIDSTLVQPPSAGAWDFSDYGGASLGALMGLATAKGYSLVHCESAGVNAFFVRNDYSSLFDDASELIPRGPNYYHEAKLNPPHRGKGSYVNVGRLGDDAGGPRWSPTSK